MAYPLRVSGLIDDKSAAASGGSSLAEILSFVPAARQTGLVDSKATSAWPAPGEIKIGATAYTDIATAISAASAGDVVKVGEGTYTVTSALTLDKNITLVGVDPARTVINCSTAETACINITGAGAQVIGIGFTNSGTGTTCEAVQIGANCTLVGISVAKTGAATTGTAIYIYADATVVMVDVDASCSGSTTSRAVRVDTATAAVVEIINGSLNGATYDVSMNSSGSTVRLRGAKLVNSTTQLTAGSLVGHAGLPSGNQAILGDLGVGVTSPNIPGTAGRRAITVEAITDRAILELSRIADDIPNNGVPGQVSFYAGTGRNTVAHLICRVRGTDEDAASLSLWTKPVGSNVQERLFVDENGDVGIGTGAATPAGRLHGRDAISGFLFWEFDGLNATVQTIIPNGIGDVVYGCRMMYMARESSGNLDSGEVLIANGGSINLTPGGGGTFRIRVNADGSMDAARTAGATTLKIALWIIWL